MREGEPRDGVRRVILIYAATPFIILAKIEGVLASG